MVILGKLSKKHCSALAYFADRLMPYQLHRHITVDVVFRRNMGHLGVTIIDEYNKSGNPRHFIIEVNSNQNDGERVRTLAHEMVHIKQYCRKELNEEATVWRDEVVNPNLSYDEQPWEIEAHSLGDTLYEEYNDFKR